MLDCPDSIISGVANDTPSAGQTTITLSGLLLTADAYNGLELRVVRPNAASNRLLYGEVLDTTSSTIVVQDDGSDSIYSALNGATQGFQVLDLPAAEASPSSTSGTWDLGAGYDPIAGTTSYTDFSAFSAAYIGMQLFPETDTYPNVSFTIIDVPNSSTVVVEGDTSAYGASAGDPYTIAERCWRYDSVNDESDYFDADASFAAFMVGWTFVPDISKPCYLPVIAVDAENGSITVKGDASGLAAPLTDRYHLIPPAGVARSTGAYAKPEDAGDSTWNGAGSYDDPGAKWLWSGYLYVTPQVGHEVSGTTYGAQSGTNHLGQYHCWNREYDVATGRWTSPDPKARPWSNLPGYISASSISRTDSTGLSGGYVIEHSDCPSDYDKCFEDLSACLKTAITSAKQALLQFIHGHTAPPPSLGELAASPVAMDQATKATAMEVLHKLQVIEEQYLLDDDLSFECHCCIGKRWNAYAKRLPSGLIKLGSVDDEINVCPMFFEQDCQHMVRTMFHEITHIVIEVNTDDLAKGEDLASSSALQKLKPSDRIKNADSWDAFLAPFAAGCTCDCSRPKADVAGCVDPWTKTNIACPPQDEWQK